MSVFAQTQHFAGAPDWTWWILGYFFLAGLAGGCYFLATLLRHWGSPADEPVARLGFYVTFPVLIVCALLLTLDLTKPLRFWHMLVNTTPDGFGLNFKVWSPMSVGVWALVLASLFALVSFVDALVRDGRLRHPLAARLGGVGAGKVWNIIGSVLCLFIASYTGVLLAVSNQPVWSDTWALGGLFLASGLSGSAALLILLTRWRPAGEASRGFLELSERLFAALELVLLVVFLLTLIADDTLNDTLGMPWTLLWLVALIGILPGLRGLAVDRLRFTSGGAVAAERTQVFVVAPSLVLISILALRAAVIFSAQH